MRVYCAFSADTRNEGDFYRSYPDVWLLVVMGPVDHSSGMDFDSKKEPITEGCLTPSYLKNGEFYGKKLLPRQDSTRIVGCRWWQTGLSRQPTAPGRPSYWKQPDLGPVEHTDNSFISILDVWSINIRPLFLEFSIKLHSMMADPDYQSRSRLI